LLKLPERSVSPPLLLWPGPCRRQRGDARTEAFGSARGQEAGPCENTGATNKTAKNQWLAPLTSTAGTSANDGPRICRARSPEGYRLRAQARAVSVILPFPLRRLKLTARPLPTRAQPAHRSRSKRPNRANLTKPPTSPESSPSVYSGNGSRWSTKAHSGDQTADRVCLYPCRRTSGKDKVSLSFPGRRGKIKRQSQLCRCCLHRRPNPLRIKLTRKKLRSSLSGK